MAGTIYLLPRSFDIEALENRLHKWPEFEGYKRNEMLAVVSCICELQGRQSYEDAYDPKELRVHFTNKAFPIPTKWLNKRVKRYRLYLDILIKFKFIRPVKQGPKKKGNFYAGHPRHFQLGLKYLEPGQLVVFEKGELKFFSPTQHQLRPAKRRTKSGVPSCKRSCNKHLELLLDAGIELNVEEALLVCQGLEAMEQTEENRWKLISASMAILSTIRTYLTESLTGKRDETSGRYHSWLTRTPGILRPYLRYEGHPLVSIDVKNSQPLFSVPVLTTAFEYLSKGIKEGMAPRELGKGWANGSTVPPCCGKSAKGLKIRRFKEAVFSGRFYEDFADALNQDEYAFIEFGPFTRADAKQAFMVVAFGKIHAGKVETYENGKAGYTSTVKRVFRETYGLAYERINRLKRPSKKHEEHHNTLAILLQTVEAIAMLDRVAPRLASIRGFRFATIHDSIVFPVHTTDLSDPKIQARIEEVKRIVTEAIKSVTGIAPQLTVELWTDNDLHISKYKAKRNLV